MKWQVAPAAKAASHNNLKKIPK